MKESKTISLIFYTLSVPLHLTNLTHFKSQTQTSFQMMIINLFTFAFNLNLLHKNHTKKVVYPPVLATEVESAMP